MKRRIMPIFRLGKAIQFPPVSLAAESGLLAIGGDLSPYRLLEAYRKGIFPWYSPGEPILWWAPQPRFVLYPNEIIISRSMRQIFKKQYFRITLDQNFEGVVSACQTAVRPDQGGTWITQEMKEAYNILHELGYAHSVEVWHNHTLVGGLYGISLGSCFFGESMFSLESNASKAALIFLSLLLIKLKFTLIDCQVYTSHLASMGGCFVSRETFTSLIKKSLRIKTFRGNWTSHPEISKILLTHDFLKTALWTLKKSN